MSTEDLAPMFSKYGVAMHEVTSIVDANTYEQMIVNRKAAAEIVRHLTGWLQDKNDRGDAYQIKFPPLPQ